MIPTQLRPAVGETTGRINNKRTAAVISLPSTPVRTAISAGRVWQVFAKTYIITGHTRSRLALVVLECPRCREAHEHRAALEFVSGKRTAPCGVRYVVHVGGVGAGGAA